jgi:hypothetical protein
VPRKLRRIAQGEQLQRAMGRVRFRQRLVGKNRVVRPAAPSNMETIDTTRLPCAPHAMHCGPSGVSIQIPMMMSQAHAKGPIQVRTLLMVTLLCRNSRLRLPIQEAAERAPCDGAQRCSSKRAIMACPVPDDREPPQFRTRGGGMEVSNRSRVTMQR